jgi:hypothetical protein
MKPGKIVILVAVVLAALLGIRFLLTQSSGASDQQQIEAALEESIQASKEGRPGGVMDKLSSRLHINEMDTSGNRNQIAEYIKKSKPDVTIQNRRAVVTGDEARIVSPVTIEANMLGQKMSRELQEVTLVFRKEDDREYLIIPTKKWKLAEVEVPDSVIYDFMQG